MGERYVDLMLNRLWLIVVVVSVVVVASGIFLSLLGPSVFLAPGEVNVVDIPDEGNLKSSINFIFVGIIAALFLVTIALLIVLYLKRKEKKKEIPRFNVFGVNPGIDSSVGGSVGKVSVKGKVSGEFK